MSRCRDPHQTSGRVQGILQERGHWKSQRGQEHYPQNQRSRLYRVSHRKSGSLYGPELGPLHTCWCSCGTELVGTGTISVSFACFGDTFPSSRLGHQALIWGYVPKFMVTCYVILDWYSWKFFSFLNWNGVEVDLGETGSEGKNERDEGKGNYGQKVIYER